MTCAELLDTLMERGIDLIIHVQPNKPEVRVIFEKTVGLQRYVFQEFLHKQHLDEVEDQRYKEEFFERAIEQAIEKFIRHESVTRPD